MDVDKEYLSDVEEILSHRYDNGTDYWATADKNLLKGRPFSTLESALYLIELGVPSNYVTLKNTAELIFSVWKEDGRF